MRRGRRRSAPPRLDLTADIHSQKWVETKPLQVSSKEAELRKECAVFAKDLDRLEHRIVVVRWPRICSACG